MPRARNIKPAFFKNELLGTADPLLSLLFASLWCLADREGRLEDRPLRIKAETFPYRDGVNVDALLDDLARLRFIDRYAVDGVRVVQVRNFAAHQNPHKNENPSVLPARRATASEKIVSVSEQFGAAPADVLIPDVLIADSPIDTVCTPAAPVRAAQKKTPGASKTAAAWAAYSAAYQIRYGAAPVCNARVNGQLANLVARLGNEAPAVAAFYVGLNKQYYVSQCHDVGTLLRDAESLRTQWATGRAVTNARARQVDRTATVHDAFAGLIAEAEAREQHPT